MVSFYWLIPTFFIGGTLGFFVGVFCSQTRELEPEKKLPLTYHNHDKNKTA